MNTFCSNLKRLRLAKHLTQEQAAERLGVSAQSVSRWECGTTLPDVMMLPKIAEAYCVTVDDLYKETSVAYDNYAQRLGSVFEATRDKEDFFRADQEYQRLLRSGAYTTEDLRLYGILHQYMMQLCIEKTTELFDQVIRKGPDEDPETYWLTKRQKIYFLSQIGRDQENLEEYRRAVEAGSEDINQWICLIMTYDFSGEGELAFETFQKAAESFPATPLLCCFGGGLFAGRKQYEEAFAYWDRALELAPDMTDAMYAKGFCYEQMGEWRKAYETWTALADHLTARGYDAEVQYPRELARKSRIKMEKN